MRLGAHRRVFLAPRYTEVSHMHDTSNAVAHARLLTGT